MDLFRTYISPILATDAVQYTLKVGTVWAVSNGIHQYIFKKAWDENWWPELRVQKGKPMQPEPTNTIRKVPRIISAAVLYGLCGLNWLVFHRWWLDVRSVAPSPLTMLGKLVAGMAVCDLFYWTYHWVQHEVSPWLYKHFHKQHHAFYTVTPEAAEHDAFPEFFMLMLTVDVLPAYFAKMDFQTYIVWRLINEIRHEHFHSGYDLAWYPPNWLPGFFTAPMHDFHHAKNSGCYALWFRFMDWAFGTDRAFWAHKERLAKGEVESKE